MDAITENMDAATRERRISLRATDAELKAMQQAASAESRNVANWAMAVLTARLRELGYLPVPKRPAGREQESEARRRSGD
jgi:hypothetical protein